MTFYLLGASLTLGVLLDAFAKDSSTPKTDRSSWAVVAVATVLWPIASVSILRQKLTQPTELGVCYSDCDSKNYLPKTEI